MSARKLASMWKGHLRPFPSVCHPGQELRRDHGAPPKTRHFFRNQRGSSKPQTFPAQPPASIITTRPFISNKTAAAPEISGANGERYFISPFMSSLPSIHPYRHRLQQRHPPKLRFLTARCLLPQTCRFLKLRFLTARCLQTCRF